MPGSDNDRGFVGRAARDVASRLGSPAAMHYLGGTGKLDRAR
jgi:hypothetical protein